MGACLNIGLNRRAKKYSFHEKLLRILWIFGNVFFRLSPTPCFGWRRFILRCFGATIGAQVHIYPTTRILFPWRFRIGDWSAVAGHVLIYNPGEVVLGRSVTVSHGAHLCAGSHDYRRSDLPLLKLPIQVGNEAWLCADCFVGPGVRIGEGAVIGARAVIIRPVEPWTVVAGNPARTVGIRTIQEPGAQFLTSVRI
jgi:putative colanic acid biosynthesis acetyltransferase WcaF